MKILLLDIETAPNTAHVWGLWEQNVGLNQLLESSYVMCWAVKWYGKDEVLWRRVNRKNPLRDLKAIHWILERADAVVHYNGTKFDIPTLNKEFILHGLTPPAPYTQIDLLKVAKNKFKFPSNRLDYVAQALGVGKKSEHEGHGLWVKCMAGDPKAWEDMKVYNSNDVLLLERVYDKFKPWIKGHANHSLYSKNSLVCPNCGSTHVQKRGFHYTSASKYQRYQCCGCGDWFRGGKSVAPRPEAKFVNV